MDTPADDNRLGRAYAAPEVTVFYDRGRCRHYAECVYRLATDAPEEPTRPTIITRDPAGPLLVRGDLHLDTPEGPLAETRAALCACGHTQNQPFFLHLS